MQKMLGRHFLLERAHRGATTRMAMGRIHFLPEVNLHLTHCHPIKILDCCKRSHKDSDRFFLRLNHGLSIYPCLDCNNDTHSKPNLSHPETSSKTAAGCSST